MSGHAATDQASSGSAAPAHAPAEVAPAEVAPAEVASAGLAPDVPVGRAEDFGSRVQLALRVGDLDASVDFYTKLFGVPPAKRRPGYANFAIATPSLKLVLLEGERGASTALDHLGVEVADVSQVTAATARLADEGLETVAEENTTCCYAVQDKVWVAGPGGEPWEVYVVKGDAPAQVARDQASAPAGCCS